MSNTEISSSNQNQNISINPHNGILFELSEQYLLQNPDLLTKEQINKSFLDMVNFITAFYKVDINDISALDSCFNQYCDLCEKYDYIPTLEIFSRFIRLDGYDYNQTEYLYFVGNGDRKKASPALVAFVKRAKKRCKDALTNTLTQTRGADVNRIFIAKAVHGMAETQPQTVEDVTRRGSEDLLGGLGIGSNS